MMINCNNSSFDPNTSYMDDLENYQSETPTRIIESNNFSLSLTEIFRLVNDLECLPSLYHPACNRCLISIFARLNKLHDIDLP